MRSSVVQSLRRGGFQALTVLCLGALCAVPAFANGVAQHGLSTFGELKYPADFKNFDYVDPNAPKGGAIRVIGTAGLITFDSFNGFIVKGDPAQGLGRTSDTLTVFDQLMVRAWDEPDSVYGLVAKTATVAPDKQSVAFELRPEAKFADGSPLTAEDVVWSFEVLKKHGHPAYRFPLRDVTKGVADGPHKVTFHFAGANLRDLPLIVATLPVFSKAWYATRDFTRTSLEPPLGSGPYKITSFAQGRSVTYQRREDYWAKDLPVSVGKYNFDTITYLYFKDRTIELQGLTAGEVDLREEFTSRDWATAYNVKPVQDGRLLKRTLKDNRPSGTQGWFFNLRREIFSDPRVRKAFDLAFDFQWTNDNLFYQLYQRTESFFENSELKATGKPQGAELALLQGYRDQVPESVFGETYKAPISNGSGQDRRKLRAARKLLREAGWSIKDRVLRNAEGDALTVEFLTFSDGFVRIILPYIENLKTLGIDATVRKVEAAQYQARVKSFDFDITTARFTMSNTPGLPLRAFFGSQAATTEGSYNLAGIKSPAIDGLINAVINAKNREELTTAARALDRVLRAGHYWVPQWYKAAHNVAHWDKFSWPGTKPLYHRGILETWWYDADKAAKLNAR